MLSTELATAQIHTWLNSADATAARNALVSGGLNPENLAACLSTVTEAPSSAANIVAAVERARGATPVGAIERWLLMNRAGELLATSTLARLGETCRGLTCAELVTLASTDAATSAMLSVGGIRFREFAKMATGRRFSAGLFHWDICGISRRWLTRVPPRDLPRMLHVLIRMGGLAPMMFPHLNPRRASRGLAEPAISISLAAMAETLECFEELRGFIASSWLRSPDTHRVSPHLAAVNAPILSAGGFVTTAGPAAADCGVFECSERRRELHREGRFTPTIGLVLWPRADMLRWWRDNRTLLTAAA